MEAKEIKSKMNNELWLLESHPEKEMFRIYRDGVDNAIEDNAVCGIWGYSQVDHANAAAICLAVNETFGNGINPAVVSDMKLLLERMQRICKENNDDFNYNDIQRVLNSAKL